ncbi:MAG: hypothetical protein IKB12_03285 [Clostridia bacterium]|nr:hypothetical protein [Clostridia bacterium]
MKRKALKITAFILALALIGGIGFFANALVGNPISKFLANRSAEKYISEAYSDMDLIIRDVTYDFKVGSYYARIYSPRSIDSNFTLHIDFFGKVLYDTYEYDVLTGENTAQRINKEYREAVDRVLNSPSYPYNSHIAFGDIEFIPEEYKDNYDVPSYAIVTETLTPDILYDINEMGRKAGHLVIYVADDELTEEKMAETLLGIKDIFDKSGVSFHAINCQIENRKADEPPNTDIKQIEVQHFLYSDIYEEGLAERVKKSIKATEEYYREMDKIKEQEIAEYEASLSENAE